MNDHDDEGRTERAPYGLVHLRPRKGPSVVSLPDTWFIACTSEELGGSHPLAFTLQDVPLVLFRDADGRPSALLDRCPHRNVPLSSGAVRQGELECAYHGWRFDGGGRCTRVPSLPSFSSGNSSRDALAFPIREAQGFVWVYSSATTTPLGEPYAFQWANAPGYASIRHAVLAKATLHAVLENALDVPHTAFLHRGLFRNEARNIPLEVRVRRSKGRVEAEYIGEPRPPGLIARILSPSGGEVEHFDRFILPSVAQVEYRIGSETHFVVESFATPQRAFETRLFNVVSFRSRLPSKAITAIAKPLALRVFAQDAAMLARQTETIETFGGEQFSSTSIDILGKHIWAMLLRASRGEIDETQSETSTTLVV